MSGHLGAPPRPVGVLGLVAKENRVIRTRDLRQLPEHRGFPPDHFVMTSFLGVPIRHRGRAVGNLYLANKRDHAEFTEHDQRLVEMLAEQLEDVYLRGSFRNSLLVRELQSGRLQTAAAGVS